MVKRGVDHVGVGVGAVILNERQEVLLLKRRQDLDSGSWTIPGGAVELFETCHEAIKRECREEVGVNIEIERFLTVVDHIVAGVAHWVSVEYLVRIAAGEPRNADAIENEELRWFSLEALPARLTQPSREALDCLARS
jgi:mutator protein MutT